MKVPCYKTLHSIAFFTLCVTGLAACNSGNHGEKGGLGSLFSADAVDKDAFKSNISATLTAVDPSAPGFAAALLKDSTGINVSYAYHLSGGEPLWFDAAGPKAAAEGLPARLEELAAEGIDPGRYHTAYIQQALGQLKKGGSFPVDSIVRWDKSFTGAWLAAAKDLLLGAAEIRKGDKQWFAGNDTAFNGATFLVTALKSGDAFPSLDSFRPEIREYGFMRKAVLRWEDLKKDPVYMSLKSRINLPAADSNLQQLIRRELGEVTLPANDSMSHIAAWIAAYQYYHQLRISGKADTATMRSLQRTPDDYIRSLHLNMERLRSLPRTTGDEHVWVNIPLMEVNYYRDKNVQFHSRVVVGKKSRQTPTLWAPMQNVVFNPPWGVPPTILKNDVGPGVGRSGPAYLSRKGLRAYDGQGRDVTASVNGANYRRFSYRQPPGAHNSLGEVKFNLPNKWDIYLHDTPHRENFGSRARALSSGCVRVQHPLQLAEAILEDRNYTPDRIDSIVQTRRTKVEQLKRYLPVYIVYLTVAADSTGSQLRYLDDVYGRDAEAMKVCKY